MEFVLNKEFDKLLFSDRFGEDGNVAGDPVSAILLLSLENQDNSHVVTASPSDEDVLLEEEVPNDFELVD